MKNKKIRRKAWTTAGLQKLKAYSENGTPVAQISKELNRSVGALSQQAFRMRIPLGEYASQP